MGPGVSVRAIWQAFQKMGDDLSSARIDKQDLFFLHSLDFGKHM